MPAFSSFQSTSLASVPEDELLQKQRSIRRTRHHNRSWSPSSIRSLQQSQQATTRNNNGNARNDKGKERETGEIPEAGEWAVNVGDMDAGLVSYAGRERVILVIGDLPSVTRHIIQSSGNYSNTLFLMASSLSGDIIPDPLENAQHRHNRFPLPPTSSQSSIATSISGNTDRPDRQVEFIQLPSSPGTDATSNLVDGYRTVIKQAERVAAKWRAGQRGINIVAAAHDAERQSASPSISSISSSGAPSKSKNFSRSLSFNLLPSTRRSSSDEETGSEKLDAIIAYLPISRTQDPEVCLQASLRHACATTTAIGPLLDAVRRSVGGTASPRLDNPEGSGSPHLSLIYVLPEYYPANLPRALQSYLASDLSIKALDNIYFQCLLLGNRTMDRKMQRQDDRRPITGLEIVLSGGMKWQKRAGNQASPSNLYLDDFKHCRFIPISRTEDFDSSSTNASYSSLTNTTTTDEEPLTPKMSREADSTFDNEAVNDGDDDDDDNDPRSTVSHGLSLSSRIRRQSKTSSATSMKKTRFFRRLFTNDHVR
ncbi:hypothetical protein QFC22_000897 [Naganishia vaughanmartiniae]|uniref:Uncharacterized protein n=1 Tax=Naganishia vaughanmartiniae TaxID=1424756 RepID=A0ACC2XJH0_9TREE|nr:hypothetical protein QFC22_000897 [Naganishia vaughanmartiniae]